MTFKKSVPLNLDRLRRGGFHNKNSVTMYEAEVLWLGFMSIGTDDSEVISDKEQISEILYDAVKNGQLVLCDLVHIEDSLSPDTITLDGVGYLYGLCQVSYEALESFAKNIDEKRPEFLKLIKQLQKPKEKGPFGREIKKEEDHKKIIDAAQDVLNKTTNPTGYITSSGNLKGSAITKRLFAIADSSVAGRKESSVTKHIILPAIENGKLIAPEDWNVRDM